MNKLFLFLLFSFAAIVSNGQDLINPKIQEVYGDHLQSLIKNDSDRLRFLNNLLDNRIKIEITEKDLSNSKIHKLSEVELYNRYNSDLVRDELFNPDTFNPLKYNLNFYSFEKEPLYYIVDNTNYIIKILPQTSK